MEKHLKIFRAHRAIAWFLAILTILLLISISFGIEVSILGVLSIINFVIAYGSRDKKSWARKCSIAYAILMLFGFPIGTLIGIYLLANNWKDWDNQTIITS